LTIILASSSIQTVLWVGGKWSYEFGRGGNQLTAFDDTEYDFFSSLSTRFRHLIPMGKQQVAFMVFALILRRHVYLSFTSIGVGSQQKRKQLKDGRIWE